MQHYLTLNINASCKNIWHCIDEGKATLVLKVKLNEDHGTCCHDSLLGCERGYGFNDNKLNISYHKHIECLLVSKSNKMFH